MKNIFDPVNNLNDVLIVQGYPPNYGKICDAIPDVKLKSTIIFTYGKTIYVPSGIELPDHLWAHEMVHVKEQLEMGVENWWDQYLSSARFRLEQELLAYRKQYGVLTANYPKAYRKPMLYKIASDLSGAMYGKIVDKNKAKSLITGAQQL